MTAKEVLAQNLQYYMDIHGKTRKEICAALNISYYTFSDWINGKKYPHINKIEKLAAYFGIDVSDLINEPIEYGHEKAPDAVSRAIKTARIKKNMTVNQLAAYVGVTPQEIRSYEAGVAFPLNHLKKLQEALDLRYFKLLGLEQYYNENHMKIYELRLNDKQLDELFVFAEFLKYKGEKENE